ncbi:hypothetical protein WJX75_000778 [Coccomyxa subellipsoidea]|uniref:IPT/TIG domain-containing protein n=1 Tax=Coccomyxa subellipsoidea TaxID=248742 RepID=A0ABR2YZK4_9CHLO
MCSAGLLWFLTLLCCIHPRLGQQGPAASYSGVNGQDLAVLDEHGSGDLGWGSVYVSGKVVGEEATCTDSSGQATLNLSVLGLPAGFATASVTCKFLPWSTLQDLLNATEQWKDRLVPANKPQAVTSLLEEVYRAEGTPARQQAVGMTSLKGQTGRVMQYNVSCALPSNLGDVSPVLLSELVGTAFKDMVVLTLAPTKLQRVAVFSLDPQVGPLSGGTQVTLQGEGFSQPMSCMFSNGSFAQTVNAKVQSASRATCVVPSWPLISLNGSNGTIVDFKVTINSCLFGFSYGYYLNPLVRRVHPETGPRYGSFPLTLYLEDSLEVLTGGKEEMLRPALRIQGASEDGGDLLLRANLTDDRRAIMATTPASSGPLTAGSHLLHVSLNGQFAGLNTSDMVINVEGPLVAMAAPYGYRSVTGAGVVEVSVVLEGPNMLRVTAQLSVAQRLLSADGSTVESLLSGPAAATLLSADEVFWMPGESGGRNVTLHLGAPDASQPPGALLVMVGNVSNADLSVEQSSTVISDIPAANFTTGFTINPNQVAYPGDAVTVPVSIKNPLLRAPAAVRYTIASTTGEDPSEYIPEDALEGVLAWDQDVGSSLNLTIPPGQCPPGSYRQNSTEQGLATVEQRQPEYGVGQDARLRAIVVRSANGTVFDLSSTFRPNVAEYGVAVPPSFGNGSLCLLPIQESASVDVYGPDGARIAERWIDRVGVDNGHNRRALLGDMAALAAAASGAPVPPAALPDLAPAAAPAGLPVAKAAAQAQAGVAAMPMKGVAVAAASDVCHSRSWPLTLELGQNQFTLMITVPPAMAPMVSHGNSSNMALVQLQGRPVNATNFGPYGSPAAAAPWRPSPSLHSASSPANTASAPANSSIVYSLSVVQLADPEHAEMTQLNATTSTKESLCVCGGSCPEGIQRSGGAAGGCMPNAPMWLNVSHKTDWVSLQPGLRWPGVPGLRVEVNGQVLSQGGDVSADQVEDTTAETQTRAQADFLPVALVLGLSPGVPVEVPIVVIAEDGVTSLRYFLYIVRDQPPANASSPASSASGSGSLIGDGIGGSASGSLANGPSSGGLHFVRSGTGTGGAGDEKDGKAADLATTLAASEAPLQPGWPVPPSRQPCPECAPCANGTYAYSWGSTHCNHCIIGTFAPRMGSKLCVMCPTNTTNLEDGSYDCPVAVLPGGSLAARYAVIVSFGVYLNGTSLDDIAHKVGVNASSVAILEHLIRSDTASAFNISVGDVNVTGISQVSRRVLYVNVTATLGVDVPPNASADDIKTALEVTNLSADDPIAMLAQNPDKFFGRTTKALDVTAEPDGVPPQRREFRPRRGRSALAAAWPALAGVCLAVLLGGCAAINILRRRSKRAARLYDALLERCSRCHPTRRMGWTPQVNASGSEDASNVALSGGGLTARSKPASFIQVQDAEPMYSSTAYSDGELRRSK